LAFFNSRTRPRVNRVLRNQLAGDVLDLVAYRSLRKHYFGQLTRPPSNTESSFRISTLGRYFGNAANVGWEGLRLASVYGMTQLLLRVQKSLSHYSDCAGCCCSEQYGDSFVRVWAVEGTVLDCLLFLYVFSFRYVCYVHVVSYIFSRRICRYGLCVRFL
jgi:hypothetical protein